MARPNPIKRIMESDLPSKTYQRRKQFRPKMSDVVYSYNLLNRHVFDGMLYRPEIRVLSLRKAWGVCSWFDYKQPTGSYCRIDLMDKWFCPQWFLNTLAHEMVHQYQWDIYRWEHLDMYGRSINERSGAHGPSFYAWKDRFSKFGLHLKMSHGQKRWFKHQDFNRC